MGVFQNTSLLYKGCWSFEARDACSRIGADPGLGQLPVLASRDHVQH